MRKNTVPLKRIWQMPSYARRSIERIGRLQDERAEAGEHLADGLGQVLGWFIDYNIEKRVDEWFDQSGGLLAERKRPGSGILIGVDVDVWPGDENARKFVCVYIAGAGRTPDIAYQEYCHTSFLSQGIERGWQRETTWIWLDSEGRRWNLIVPFEGCKGR